MVQIGYRGRIFDCRPRETVLDALLRQGAEVSYSCKSGVCQSCLMRVQSGTIPAAAQRGLRPALRGQGYFLPCVCTPDSGMAIESGGANGVFVAASVRAVSALTPRICRVRLQPESPFPYRTGQFVNLRRDDGLMRSYSLCGRPGDGGLELHVKRMPGGAMSEWIFRDLRPGMTVDLQGPNGIFFLPDDGGEQPLLLIGTGSGLGPLAAIAQEALGKRPARTVALYHGSHAASGLYLRKALAGLAGRHANFSYVACVSGEAAPADARAGRANEAALADHPDLAGWQVFLCGYAAMVHDTKKRAYLAGAALDDIVADAYELRELRKRPRAAAA